MSMNPSFDLGSLADVESPEVVKEALRNFRRRTLRNLIWVVAVVAMLAFPLIQQSRHKDARERIEAADGYDAGTVYTEKGITLVLVRVADLGDRTGLHLLTTSAGLGTDIVGFSPQVQNVYYPDSEERGSGPVFQGWYAVSVPDDGKIRVSVFVPDQQGRRTFTVDLRAIGVPERLWHKEDVR